MIKIDKDDPKVRKLFKVEFVKRPVVVRAIRMPDDFEVETLEGVMRGKKGDWLIQGVEGELYPCKDEIFRKTYVRKGEESVCGCVIEGGEIVQVCGIHMNWLKEVCENVVVYE